jgi:hypothetical protein
VARHAHQFFLFSSSLFFVSIGSLSAALVPGQIYPLEFVDVDGHVLSTADGHVSVVVLATSAEVAKARTVGDRVPDYCLGNPTYRMVTVLNLNGKHSRLARPMVTWLIRQRLNLEGKRLQERYDARKIPRDARRDVFTVADFDGAATSKLDAPPEASTFRVFVFGRDGKLLREWNELPNAADLAAVL